MYFFIQENQNFTNFFKFFSAPTSYVELVTLCINWRKLMWNDVNWCQMTSIDNNLRQLTSDIMMSIVNFASSLTSISLTRQLWRFWHFNVWAFYDMLNDVFKNLKKTKNNFDENWRKLTIESILSDVNLR